MLSIENLKQFGANTEEGLKRCVNKADFYIRMVNTALKGDQMEQLAAALQAKDLDKAFEIAHTLKGVYGNLSLTPLYNPMSEMTELLRARTDTDYGDLLGECQSKLETLKQLAQ